MVGKIICIILIVGTGWLFTPVATASSQSVVITAVQSGVTGGANQELIAIHNNSDISIDVTDWCLQNKALVAFFCFKDPSDVQRHFILDEGKSAVIFSAAYAETHHYTEVDGFIFTPSHSTSGSLVGSSDTLRLIDASRSEIDRYSWVASWPSGSVAQREIDSDPTSVRYGQAWQISSLAMLPPHEIREVEAEVTPDALPRIVINELLPNPEGADAEGEYIELYNHDTEAHLLEGYTIVIKGTSVKSFVLSSDVTIDPMGYKIIDHSMLDFTLPNSIAEVALLNLAGEIISQTEQYEDPPDGATWSLFGVSWKYTYYPTPASENRLMDALLPTAAQIETQKPCPSHQYRHPDTGRCRNTLSSDNDAPAPCKLGQYRHPETKRCRSIEQEASVSPCKEGQERNSETGRCRKIQVMSNVQGKVLDVKTENRPQQWYIVAIIVGVFIALTAYAAWEWRQELRKAVRKIRAFIIHSK